MTRSTFESSLAALRDNVVMAIERRELGVVQDGLDVYQHLIETILDEQRRLQVATSNEAGPNLPLGREWDQILRDLHGVIDSASASTSRLLWIDVISWVGDVAIACADRGVLNALGMILDLFRSAWDQELAAPSPDAKSRQDALLLRLAEFGTYYLRLGVDDQERVSGAEVVYMRTFLQVVKRAIESGDPETAQVTIKYFLHGNSFPGSKLNPITGAGLLALYAWILYRFDRGEQEESFKAVCTQIATAFAHDEAFVTILRESHKLENELGVHWWEMRERGPTSGGVVQIGTYMTLALLLVAAPSLAWQPLDPEKEADVDSARRMIEVIDSFNNGSFSGARSALSIPSNHFDPLKTHLSDVIQEGDARLEETYSQLPIDPDRVSAFRSAIRSKLTEERESDSLMAALLVPPTSDGEPESAPEPAPEAESESTAESEPESQQDEAISTPATERESAAPYFGLDRLFARSYFAKTRVHAEPERLATELVRGLARGEENKILDIAISDLSDATETTLDTLSSALLSAISNGPIGKPVVVTNSYQAYAHLKGRSLGPVDNPPSPFTAGKVVRVYDDRPAYVGLLSAGASPMVQLLPPSPEIDGDEVLGDLAILVGVSEVPRDKMDEIIGREHRTRLEEARLRGSVRIRLYERPDISMAAAVRPVIWTLPDSTL